jgi:ferrous-iron efflux pump FieF
VPHLHCNSHNHLASHATFAAVCTALILVTTKTFAWWFSGSLTIQASLLDSLSDLLSSMINFFAVRYARKPANDEYRFGYGKAEALAGFLQSILIIASTFWMVWHAYHRLALVVMAISTILTLCLVIFQLYTIKRTNSIAVKADFLHYQADLLSNVAAIIALLAMSWFEIGWIDTAFGIGIAIFLLYGSIAILKQSFNILMDKELPKAIRRKIRKIIQTNTKVIDVHELRTRSAGHIDFIQLHITLDPSLNLQEAHIIGDEVEETLKKSYPQSEILIHLDPQGYHPKIKES